MVDIESPYIITEVVRQRTESGYLVREELIDDSEWGGDGALPMTNCYCLSSGVWIGDENTAKYLCETRGLRAFEKRTEQSCGASIAFQPDEQKWYGWSHRAIYGFGVGSTCKRGDSHYTPSTVEELYEDHVTAGYDRALLEQGVGYLRVHDSAAIPDDTPVDVAGLSNVAKPVELAVVPKSPRLRYYDISIGKGEWTATTLDEAKQMACDFAESVS